MDRQSEHSGSHADDASRRAFLLRAAGLTGSALIGSTLLCACDSGPSSRSRLPRFEPLPPDVRPAAPGSVPPAPPLSQAIEVAAPRQIDLHPPRREPLVRVLIERRGPGAGPIEIDIKPLQKASGKRQIRVGRVQGDALAGAVAGVGPMLLVLTAPIRVAADSGNWSVIDAAGTRSTLDTGALEFAPVDERGGRLKFGGAEYPGVIRLVARSSGSESTGRNLSATAADDSEDANEQSSDAACLIINVCRLEQYLPGVLARELYPNWHAGTFAAQAVAARSFAVVEMAFWRDVRYYDVAAGQSSQAYAGTTASAGALRAVRDSAGVMLLFGSAAQERVVPGYYSSCCGGLSADARDAISPHTANDIPPLRAQPPRNCCAWAPLYRWTSEQSPADAARRLNGWAARRPQWGVPSMAQVTAIEAVQLNAYGRPVRYRVSDGRGARAELPAEHLRAALNSTSSGLPALRTPLRSGHFSTHPRGGALQFSGQGFGHGAGLCQYGAEGLARRGVDWREVLQTYYPGARVAGTYS